MSNQQQTTNVTVRFWSHVKRGNDDECWPWLAATNQRGYGMFMLGKPFDRKTVLAHRFAYELIIGKIPDGKEPDHTCNNPKCVNPYHLEPVTHAENVRRALTKHVSPSCEHESERRLCSRGHALECVICDTRKFKQCRECATDRMRAFRSRERRKLWDNNNK